MSDIEFIDDSTSDSETEEDTNDSFSDEKKIILLPVLVLESKVLINEHFTSGFIKLWRKTGFLNT